MFVTIRIIQGMFANSILEKRFSEWLSNKTISPGMGIKNFLITGIFASVFSILLIFISSQVPAIEGSPIDDTTFNNVFLNAPLAVLASMLTYLFAQFIDIRVYHFWKRLTKGKHLWLRNNFSTFTSQFVDTFTIVSLLIIFEILPQDKFLVLIVSGFLFKVMVAIFDTPLLYLCVWLFRRKFNLKVGEEIKLN